jgi:cobalt/nickel transport system permease protein
MTSLEMFAHTNRLRSLPAKQKGLFALGMLGLTFLMQVPVQMMIFIWMGIWIVIYARIPIKFYLKMIGMVSLFLLISLPMLVVSVVPLDKQLLVQEDSIWSWAIKNRFFYFSKHGWEQGWLVLVRSLASISCLFFLILTTPFAEIVQLLRKMGCPTMITEILLVMYRFIFSFWMTAEQQWIAIKARGGERRFRSRLRSMGFLIANLFQKSLIHYRQLSQGLAARGFTGEIRVYHRSSGSMSKRFFLESIVGIFVLLILDWYLRRS